MAIIGLSLCPLPRLQTDTATAWTTTALLMPWCSLADSALPPSGATLGNFLLRLETRFVSLMKRAALTVLTILLLLRCGRTTPTPPATPSLGVSFHGVWYSQAEMHRIGRGEKNVKPTEALELFGAASGAA
jgi:hypothetical protein